MYFNSLFDSRNSDYRHLESTETLQMNYNNLVYLYDSKDEFSPGDNRTKKGHPDTKDNESLVRRIVQAGI